MALQLPLLDFNSVLKRKKQTFAHTQDNHTQCPTVLPNILIQNGRVWGERECATLITLKKKTLDGANLLDPGSGTCNT